MLHLSIGVSIWGVILFRNPELHVEAIFRTCEDDVHDVEVGQVNSCKGGRIQIAK